MQKPVGASRWLAHRRSIRLKGWDYRESAWYFITICTHEKSCLFSRVKDGKIELTDLGKIVHDEWTKTALIRPDIHLDDFVIMPNHIHAILALKDDPAKLAGPQPSRLQARSLGAIIAQFKSSVTKRVMAMKGSDDFHVWQRGYFERIIRDDVEWYFVQQYIAENPKRWEEGRKLGSFRRTL